MDVISASLQYSRIAVALAVLGQLGQSGYQIKALDIPDSNHWLLFSIRGGLNVHCVGLYYSN